MEKAAIVFDTNIFGMPSEYNFNDLKITTFLNSFKFVTNIDIFIPSIVYNEIVKHIKESIKNDKKTKMSRYYRDNISSKFFDSVLEKTIKEFDSLLKKYKVKTFDCNKYIDISEVNNWYFNRLLPFEEAKPKEFPDAMIISSLKNYFKTVNYDTIYVISNDKGFNLALKRETNFAVFESINLARKEILGYDDSELFQYRNYLLKYLDVFNDTTKFIFSSRFDTDVIDVSIINIITIGNIDILAHVDNKVLLEVEIAGNILGDFYVFDPYDSLFDDDTNGYCYMQYRMADNIKISDESVYIELFLDSTGKIERSNLLENNNIDILHYLNQMDIVYD